MLYTLPKPQIQDLSQQWSKVSSSLNSSLVGSNVECFKVILMQSAFLIEESNR